MALQWRLTIWFGSLIVILILAHWWLMRSLGRSVLVESAYFAADVSHEILFEVEEGTMLREFVENSDGDRTVYIKHVEMRNSDKPNLTPPIPPKE